MNVSNPKACYFQGILIVLPAQSSIYIHISTTNLQTHYYFYLKVKVERWRVATVEKHWTRYSPKETDLDVGTGHQIYKLLHSLIEGEKACLSEETMEASIQPWYRSYIFREQLTSLAHDPKKTTERSIFGMPFHCTMCPPDWAAWVD